MGINLLMFLPAYFFRTDKLTDISYAVTFVVLALYGFFDTSMSSASIVLFILVLLWAVRLGSYLLVRIHKIKRDKRFDGMRENFWSFVKFWLLQGVTVWFVMIPSLLFFGRDVQSIPAWAYVGVLVWVVGIIIEAVSDIQKYKFINNPENKGKWMASGLWKYSRHPNYFGEILLWLGVYIFVISGLGLVQSLVALIGPLFITCLIIFVSGIPLLEKAADKRWGENPEYQKYKKRTSSLIPFLLKRI